MIKPDHMQVRSRSHLDYYLGQWVNRVCGTYPLTMLFYSIVSSDQSQSSAEHFLSLLTQKRELKEYEVHAKQVTGIITCID